ncbi:MAG: hypothetical protein Q4Q06_02150 [Bacteroidota bacterium]|nr:hypothetical protein [Bacteroidota bacterium]
MEQNVKAIGGYFELELPKAKEYYPNALALNTGRNCLEYILRLRKYKKVYLPYYTCEVLFEPFNKLNISYEFYHIDKDFHLIDDITLKDDEALLYTNYYGLQQQYVKALATKYSSNLIIDNTQAFFAEPLKDVDSFNTCRKFFGVSDGAYCFTNKRLEQEFEQETSFNRMNFLLKRIDLSAEEGYNDFRQESENLCNLDIHLMSNLTQRIMSSIDYNSVSRQRRANFLYLHKALQHSNELNLSLQTEDVPMVYPYLIGNEDLRAELIANKIFVARYWSNVLEDTEVKGKAEEYLTTFLLPLPIDQRYNKEDMQRIIEIITR